MNSPISRSSFLIDQQISNLHRFDELDGCVPIKYPLSAHKIYYSFQYLPDNWRALLVRNLDIAPANKPVSPERWNTVKQGGPDAIRDWIGGQMSGRDCTVVLVGTNTAGRVWINHEIIKSWQAGMGVVGIRVHGLENAKGKMSTKGRNPFGYIDCGDHGQRLSSIVNCYKPQGHTSEERLDWIGNNLARIIEEAIEIRRQY
jgi:Thoeris protein ThsB, TIR-like domain